MWLHPYLEQRTVKHPTPGQKLQPCPYLEHGTVKHPTLGQKLQLCPYSEHQTVKHPTLGQKLQLCPYLEHRTVEHPIGQRPCLCQSSERKAMDHSHYELMSCQCPHLE